MRVAILVKEFPPDIIGGTETQTRRMARALSERGHEVTVYTKAYGTDRPDDEEPMEIVRVPNLRLNPFVSTLTFVLLATLYLIRDARKYDILQCMMIYPSGFVGLVVNRLTGLPYFAWVRGGDFYFMKDTPGKRWMIARVLDDGLVLTQTDRVSEDVRAEFPDANLKAIYNGVPVPETTADGDALVFVGRLKEQKGVHNLLRAAEGLDRPVLIVGDGPERERLETLAADLDVDAEFVGQVPPTEVPEYLARGSVFVLPSIRGEGGTPNAVLEALAVGLPVLVTDTGGMLPTIESEPIGYMVPPDDVNALREKLRLLCEDESLRNELAENAREYVQETHSWDALVDGLEDVYDRVIAEQTG
ncbi:MAG: glycosyltransferase family 4 protein [Haloarculaceae archaeon]